MSSVKVAVRIRPFNGREKGMNAKLNIRSQDGRVWIMNPVRKTAFKLIILVYRKTAKKKNLHSIMHIGVMTVTLNPRLLMGISLRRRAVNMQIRISCFRIW